MAHHPIVIVLAMAKSTVLAVTPEDTQELKEQDRERLAKFFNSSFAEAV